MRSHFTRRQFLVLTSLSALATGFRTAHRPLPPEDAPTPELGLGRVIAPRVTIRTDPHSKADRAWYKYADNLINLRSAVEGQGPPEYNRVWYQVEGGYVHSGMIQPVRFHLQTPLAEFPGENFLTEVSVPFTDSRLAASPFSERSYRLYYGTTHWVTAVLADQAGEIWYRIWDDKWNKRRYVRGRHLRRILPEELTPLSPAVTEKLLEVNIETQRVRAYEEGHEVFSTPTATGDWYLVDGIWKDYTTPLGAHVIGRKTPSRHMAAGDLASGDGYDLPGVPWVSYFTASGVAFHGTYWHSDYGLPRSHGCVNVPSEAAKWIYRWSLPRAPASEQYVWEQGTRVVVT
jgi:hypothetical protein